MAKVLTLIDLVCFPCEVDKIYDVGEIAKPNMGALMELQAEGMKHTAHGGYMINLRVTSPEDIDRLQNGINKEQIKRILAHKVS